MDLHRCGKQEFAQLPAGRICIHTMGELICSMVDEFNTCQHCSELYTSQTRHCCANSGSCLIGEFNTMLKINTWGAFSLQRHPLGPSV